MLYSVYGFIIFVLPKDSPLKGICCIETTTTSMAARPNRRQLITWLSQCNSNDIFKRTSVKKSDIANQIPPVEIKSDIFPNCRRCNGLFWRCLILPWLGLPHVLLCLKHLSWEIWQSSRENERPGFCKLRNNTTAQDNAFACFPSLGESWYILPTCPTFFLHLKRCQSQSRCRLTN